MSDSDITRRTFLRGLGGTAVALPVLGSDLPEAAAAPDAKASSNGPFPKRLVVFYHPNGVLPSAWWPEPGETESDFDLGGPLEPLKPFRDRLLFLKGLEMKSPAAGPGGPHQQGMGGVLTGRPLQEGQMIGNDGSRAGWGDGISIDQAVAEEVGGGTPFKSLELGVRANSHGGSRVRTRLSYAGPAQPQPPQDDPTEVFDQLFSDGKTPPGSHDQIRQRRASILDTVQKQFDHVADRVSARDRRRLERHLSRVRNLETRLRKNGLSGENCKPPAKPADRDPDSEATMPKIASAQLDLATMALSCDLTRVVSIQVSNSVNHIRYPWVGSLGDGHALSHAGPSNTSAHREWIKRDRWHAEQFATMLGKLDAIPEGDGTMLDNTLLLWVVEVSKGNTHSFKQMPFVLAGNVDDQFDTGRLVEYASAKSHNDLLAAIGKAFGRSTETFGDSRFSTGPLAGLT